MNLRKPLSVIVSLSLVWTCGSGAEALLSLPQVLQGPSFLPQIELAPPLELGRITDYHNANGSEPRINAKNPLVIIVQDLHAHYGVQKNIAALLEFFARKLPKANTASGEPFALAVEGDEGPIDTSLMALFPNPEIKRDSLDYLMREGELTGMEYYAAMHNRRSLLVGVENKQYYQLHRDLFRKTYKSRALIMGGLHNLQKDLRSLNDTTYRPIVKNFLTKQAAFENGLLSSDAYLGYLVAQADSLRISLETYPKLYAFAKTAGLTERLHTASVIPEPAQLREWTLSLLKTAYSSLSEPERRTLAMLSNQSNYVSYYLYIRDLIYTHKLYMTVPPGLAKYLEYLYIVQTAGFDSVINEAQMLAFHIQQGLSSTQAEKDLTQVQHDLTLLAKVADLQATESDVRAFTPRLNQLIAMAKALLNPTGAPSGRFDEAEIRRLVSSSIDFYAMALVRNKPMVEHTLALVSPQPKAVVQNPNVVVLVAGGFHTSQMTQLFKERGASFIVVTPTVDRITPEQHELYVKRLNGHLLTTQEMIADALAESPELL
jgi:hypothetical protein